MSSFTLNARWPLYERAGPSLMRADRKVSQDDLVLLATPDKDLISASHVFSFERDLFEARIKHGDRWQQLIVANLYLEHIFDRLLREALPNPEAISLGRLGFAQRIALSRAMALLSADLVSMVKAISKLRNRVAHDLNFEIGEKEVADLLNCTPKALRDIAGTEEARPDGPLQFHEILRVGIYQVEVIRQGHVAGRALGRKGEIRLRTVLDQTPGAIYVP